MSHKFLLKSSFHELLNRIDRELAEHVRLKGCQFCGGILHWAPYPRSPFGLPAQFRDYYAERLSFCCDNCRRRTTPQSVRFFGRRWFPAPLLILISALLGGVNDYRRERLKELFGVVVSESTWKRWRRWWRDAFTKTSFWTQNKGHFLFSEGACFFPRSLLTTFQGGLFERLCHALKFFSPITAGVLRAV